MNQAPQTPPPPKQGQGLDVISQGAGENVRKVHARDVATSIVTALFRLVKLSTLHSIDNQAMVRQVEETVTLINDYGSRTDHNVSILFAHGSVFVAGLLLRANRGVYEGAVELGDILSRVGCGEIGIKKDVRAKDLYDFVSALAEALRSPKPPLLTKPAERIRMRSVNAATLSRETMVEKPAAADVVIARTYASAVVIMRRFFDEMRKGNYELPQRVKRVAQRLVDLSTGETPAFLGVTAARNANQDDAGRAVNSAILSLAMARQVTPDMVMLSRIAMAALLFDSARARLVGAVGKGGPVIMPQLSEAQEAEAPAGTAVVLTALSRVNEPGVMRTVMTYEAHWVRRQALLGPPYRSLRQASLQARIIATARAFNDLLTPAPGQTPLGADEAIARIERDAADASDRTVLRLLVGALGIFPTGTIVELATGETAVVVQTPSHPSLYSQPRVRLVFDAKGNSMPRPVEVDLAARRARGEPARHIKRVVATSDDASAAALRAHAAMPLAAPAPGSSSGVRQADTPPPAQSTPAPAYLPQRQRQITQSSPEVPPQRERQITLPSPEQSPQGWGGAPPPASPVAIREAVPPQAPVQAQWPADPQAYPQGHGAMDPRQAPPPAQAVYDPFAPEVYDPQAWGAETAPVAGAAPQAARVEPLQGDAAAEGDHEALTRAPTGDDLQDARAAVAAAVAPARPAAPAPAAAKAPAPAAETPTGPTAQGSFTKTPLAHLLVYMLDQRLGGTAIFREPSGVNHTVYFSDGAPAKIRTGAMVAPLDRVILAHGLLDEATLGGTMMEISKKRILHGRHLVAKGLLDRTTVMSMLQHQLVAKMMYLFELPAETTYEYYKNVNQLASWGGPELMTCEPLALIMSGIRIRASDPLIDATLEKIAKRPIGLHIDAEMKRFELHRDETSVVDMLRTGKMTLGELLAAGVAQERVVKLTMYALTITRHLDLGSTNRPPVGLINRDAPPQAPAEPQAAPPPPAPPAPEAAPPPPAAAAPAPAQPAARTTAADPAGRSRSGFGISFGQPRASGDEGPRTPPPESWAARAPAPSPSQPQISSGGTMVMNVLPQGGGTMVMNAPQPPSQNFPQGGTMVMNAPQSPPMQPQPAFRAQEPMSPPSQPRPLQFREPMSPAPQARPSQPSYPEGDRISSPPTPPPLPPRQARTAAAPARPEPPTPPPAPAPQRAAAAAPPRADLVARRTEIEKRLQSIDSEDLFEMLGIGHDALPDQVKAAYFGLAKRWHPDRLPPELQDLKDPVARVFARFNEAFQTLSDDTRRADYVRTLSAGGGTTEDDAHVARVIDAAMEFQKAEILLKKHDLTGAEGLARQAAEADPDQPEYRTLLVWIQAQRRGDPPNLQEGMTSAHFDDLIKTLDGVIAKEPRYEKALFYRGSLLKRSGRIDRAIRDFRLSAEINPKNIDAVREIRLYDMRKRTGTGAPAGAKKEGPKASGQEGTGLLGKFFKR